jgi:hypothetical protein
VKLGPNRAECLLERGRAHWKLGNADEAEEDFVKAVDRDPRLQAEVARIKGK